MLSIQLQGLDKVIKAFDQFPDIAGRELRVAFNRSSLAIQRQVQKAAPADTGQYRSSIYTEVDTATVPAYARIGSGLMDTRTRAFRSVSLEEGTEAHFVPASELVDWVHRKRLAGRYSKKTKRRLGNKTNIRDEDMNTAMAIAKAIGEHGTKAQPHWGPAFESNLAMVQREFDAAVERIVKAL